MARLEPEVRVGCCRLITIGTDSVLGSKEWRARLGAGWPFLSDEDRRVQMDLEILQKWEQGERNAFWPCGS